MNPKSSVRNIWTYLKEGVYESEVFCSQHDKARFH
jgi:hypothetical protein